MPIHECQLQNRFVGDARWKEAEHSRASNGQFGSGDGGQSGGGEGAQSGGGGGVQSGGGDRVQEKKHAPLTNKQKSDMLDKVIALETPKLEKMTASPGFGDLHPEIKEMFHAELNDRKKYDQDKETQQDDHEAASIELNDHEQQEFKNYSTTEGYEGVNEALRKGTDPSESAKNTIKQMDSAFSRASTKKDMTVFRTIRSGFADKLKVGDVFSDKAYSSTSTDEKASISAALATGITSFGTRGGDLVLMKVSVPKGSKAISINNISDQEEGEIVLDRNSKFKVTGEDNSGTFKVLMVEYIK